MGMMDSSRAQCGGSQQIRVTVLMWDNKGWTMRLSKLTLRLDQHPRSTSKGRPSPEAQGITEHIFCTFNPHVTYICTCIVNIHGNTLSKNKRFFLEKKKKKKKKK